MTLISNVFSEFSLNKLKDDSLRFAVRINNGGLSPFCRQDTSAGMEYEMQVAVIGSPKNVDLPKTIRESSFFRNTAKHAARGDLHKNSVSALTEFLDHNESEIWENSWVRFEENRLSQFAANMLAHDFLADKRFPDGPLRCDLNTFKVSHDNKPYLRIPISYLLKMAFADILSPASGIPESLHHSGSKLLHNFQSDNTSPEILSLTIPVAVEEGVTIGLLAARETARTFLVSQLLTQYANTHFGLTASDQHCIVYNAPLAPSRQKKLNELVPDGFYRHLFMSPCLSGWDKGEEKHRYMSLCHQTLSRSQLNAIGKLKDAGIISNNLVILPNTSNTCLANNGTHVSLGSTMLTRLAGDPESGLSPSVEKYFGDLVIKIVEHFLPLFVNTYTAAPYRVDFADFHPEKVLGFLPHELDYTHLRMLWRRWKKKADIRFMGKPITPFGPHRVDQFLARVLRLHGDIIPDFRLIDYFITLLSTESCPALNGIPGNQQQLKYELTEMGIFDSRMSMYLPYRMRAHEQMGYSGFEGRSYSLFPSFLDDMAEAVDLQNLVTAFAYKLVLQGEVLHDDIPDQPFIESERRQIFFGTAIGIPTVYIRADSGNSFLRSILANIPAQRPSKRYRNYIRVKTHDYRLALLKCIATRDAGLVDELGAKELLDSLHNRLVNPQLAAAGKIIRHATGILRKKRTGAKIPAETFNAATEKYYRTELKAKQLREGLMVLLEDCMELERKADPNLRKIMKAITPEISVQEYLGEVEHSIRMENASPTTLRNILHLCLAVCNHHNTRKK
jgi:hypothetical protein